MTCWAVIPIKAGSDGKSRLADVLDDVARQALVRSMLERVVNAAADARMIDRVMLVGASRHGLPEDIELLEDPGTGLNGAVQSALGEVAKHGVDRILIVAADLPGVRGVKSTNEANPARMADSNIRTIATLSTIGRTGARA